MKKLFSEDSGIRLALASLADDMLYSILTLICSLPVITAGTAVTALFDLIMRSETHREIGVRVFFQRFVYHFRRTTLSWIALAAADTLFIFAFRLTARSGSSLRTLMFGSLFFLFWILLLLHIYLPPVFTAERNRTVLAYWKESVFTGIALLPRSVLIFIVILVPVMLYISVPELFWSISFIWLFFWPAVLARIVFRLIRSFFPEFSDLPPADQEDQ